MYLDCIIDDILIYSNLQGRRTIYKWNSSHPNRKKKWKLMDRTEIEAFIGLLILLGTFRSKYRDIEELWSPKDGFPVCRATMTMERFLQIKSVIRFDDPLRRDRSDVLAPVRNVYSIFNNKLRQLYIPGPYLTVDEQLLEYHGRVKFQQYISSKPGKFGIKFLWLCDAESFYALNSVIYIGKGTIEPEASVTSMSVTMHLMAPFLNSGRHLTGDNWFSSLPLVQELRRCNTSYIGTLRKNNRAMPPIANSTANRVRKDSKILYDSDGTILVSFWDKGASPVTLIDTFHKIVPVPDVNSKACTVLEYNRTKSGVDIADKRFRGFSCKRKCRRWPYAVFSNMIDIACSNGSIIYSSGCTRNQERHYKFMKSTGYQLVDDQIKRRLSSGTLGLLSSKIKSAMIAIGYDVNDHTSSANSQPSISSVRLPKAVRCAFCDRSADRKTFSACPKCKQPCCNIHRSNLCINC